MMEVEVESGQAEEIEGERSAQLSGSREKLGAGPLCLRNALTIRRNGKGIGA
jgi:hypothetical protein